MKCMFNFWEDVSGAVAAEYALLIGLVALAIFAGLNVLGTTVAGLYQEAVDKYPK